MASVIGSAILRTQTDERLAALAGAGHQRAFETIVERYRAELTRSLRRLLPSSTVEDALQQTYLQAWKALTKGTEVRELRAWLHRIARNAATAVASRGYEYAELEDALLVAPGPDQDLERREAVRRTLRGIAELPERQREALLAVAVAGCTHADVALELGITDTAARQLVRRARVSLLALASLVTPPQLVQWAARAGHSMVAGKAAAGTGFGGGLAGSAIKAGAIAVTVGGVVAGVAPIRQAFAPPPPPARHHHHHLVSPSPQPPAYLAAVRRLTAAATPGAGAAPTTHPVGRAPAAPHAAHHLRRVRPDAIGKLLTPAPAGATLPSVTPATLGRSPVSPTAPSAGADPATATATGTGTAKGTAEPSAVAALVAWWFAGQPHPAAAAYGPGATGDHRQGQSAGIGPGWRKVPAGGDPGGCPSVLGEPTAGRVGNQRSSSGVEGCARWGSTSAPASAAAASPQP